MLADDRSRNFATVSLMIESSSSLIFVVFFMALDPGVDPPSDPLPPITRPGEPIPDCQFAIAIHRTNQVREAESCGHN